MKLWENIKRSSFLLVNKLKTIIYNEIIVIQKKINTNIYKLKNFHLLKKGGNCIHIYMEREREKGVCLAKEMLGGFNLFHSTDAY